MPKSVTGASWGLWGPWGCHPERQSERWLEEWALEADCPGFKLLGHFLTGWPWASQEEPFWPQPLHLQNRVPPSHTVAVRTKWWMPIMSHSSIRHTDVLSKWTTSSVTLCLCHFIWYLTKKWGQSGVCTSSTDMAREQVRNVGSQTSRIRICRLGRPAPYCSTASVSWVPLCQNTIQACCSFKIMIIISDLKLTSIQDHKAV